MSNTLLNSCLKIHGITNTDIARKTGFSQSYVNKIILGVTYNTSRGPKIRRNKKIETAIAASLGLTHKQAWGSNAEHHIKQAIEQALKSQKLSYSLSHTAQQVNVHG